MYLDYSRIEFDSYDRPETPQLVLQTLGGTTLGPLSNVMELSFHIKYSELSEMSFKIPAYTDGIKTPFYNDITGYKVIYTKNYGVYLVMKPSVSGDGIEEVKEVKGYSIEKELDKKTFFLEDGTFNFWNPASPTDTILGRILELAPGWSVGEVSSTLWGRYRTFDSFSGYLLSFIYNDAPEKFRCAFVFDPYEKKINAYDLDEEITTLPIYLDFNNLVQEIEVSELTDELVTAIRPYGADDLDIRSVNPTGTNWLYDLSYFISNGDIDAELAKKWDAWQAAIAANQEYYKGLVCMRASATSRLLVEQAKLTDIEGELQDLTNQQSVIIQQMANGDDTLQDDLDNINELISKKKAEIAEKESDISEIETELNDESSGYNAQIKEITERLSIKNPDNFTEDEYAALSKYFIEEDITENTFVATSVDTTVSGSFYNFDTASVKVTGAQITEIDLSVELGKKMYTVTGGYFSVSDESEVLNTTVQFREVEVSPPVENEDGTTTPAVTAIEPTFSITPTSDFVAGETYIVEYDGVVYVRDAVELADNGVVVIGNQSLIGGETDSLDPFVISTSDGYCAFAERDIGDVPLIVSIKLRGLSGEVIRGTLDRQDDGSFVMSVYAGLIKSGGASAAGGMVSLYGTTTQFENDIHSVEDGDVVTMEGSQFSFESYDATVYMTASVGEYQAYSVSMELYDYATDVLKDMASATYEFDIDSANFLFAKEFSPFRNALRLGDGVYLRLLNDEVITPRVIEVKFEFENWSKMSLIFSNQFKRRDNVNTLKDMIESSYSSGRKFDSSQYIYGEATSVIPGVTEFMNSSLNAAVNKIIGSSDNSVVIDGAGIHIGGNSNYQLRIVDSMIAMSDDGWQTAKLAIGHFASDDIGDYWGVNAEVIGGKLLVGNNLIIENSNDIGVMQFKVDSTGAWLNNSTFVLQKDAGGKIIIDPAYGIAAGTDLLFNTSGTTVTPGFVDSETGEILLDEDGFPENSNFYLDIDDGTAYFRGKLKATSGSVGGWTIAENQLYSGSGKSFVALNSSGEDNSLYAIWAGADSPEEAPFWVKRDGTLYSKGGTFSGTVYADDGHFTGTITAKDGTFSGTLDAAKIGGNLEALLADDDSGWLIGCGIKVGENSSGGYNFMVDKNGNVTLAGNITWGASNSPVCVLYGVGSYSTPTGSYDSYPDSSSTGWHKSVSSNDYYASYSYDGGGTWTDSIAFRGKDGKDGEDGQDGDDAQSYSYLTRSGITSTTIFSPSIYGGLFYATGQGSSSGAAYYISNGVTGAGVNTKPNNPIGWISYDTNGSGTTEEAQNRVIFRTVGVPIKIEAGTDLSISCDSGSVFMMSPLRLGPNYGTSLPGSGAAGQVFFLIES